MIKLYGTAISNNVNKISYCLDYLKLPYESVPINLMKGEQQSPEFLNICPTGKVPALEDNGFTVFESNAILRYLAKREKSPIYPEDVKRAAIVDAWIDYSSIHISNALGRIAFNRIFAPLMKKEVDEKSLLFGLEMMDKYLPVINTQLSKNKFIAGNEFSIADINLLAVLDPCEMVKIDLTPYKEITTWRNNLRTQDFYQKGSKAHKESVQDMMAAMSK